MFLATAAVTIELHHLYQKHFCHTCRTTSFLNFFSLSSASSRPRCINNGVLFSHQIALPFWELRKKEKRYCWGRVATFSAAYQRYSLKKVNFFSVSNFESMPSVQIMERSDTNSKSCFSISTTEKWTLPWSSDSRTRISCTVSQTQLSDPSCLTPNAGLLSLAVL